MAWKAEYYNGIELSGQPLVEQDEEAINLASEDDLPQEVKDRLPLWAEGLNRIHTNLEWFSVRWTKSINGPGRFRVECTTDDGMRVWIDGQRVINSWRDQAPSNHSAEKQLSPGPHQIKVEYYQGGGGFRARLTVERIGGQSEAQIRRAWEQVTQTGHLTRGGLEAARIYEADDDGNPIYGSAYEIMYCMINPVSYKIKKSSKMTVKGLDEDKNYNVSFEMDKIEPSQLTIKELWFDTSETRDSNGRLRDVSEYTDRLMEYAEITAAKYANFKTAETASAPPPKVAFQWGSFRFLGVIESLNVKFVLFARDGTPIRARVSNLKMREFRHRKAYPRQNPSSGGGPTERIWRVTEGERLDMIAAHIYGDAALWRRIARHNDLMDPLAIHPGQTLRIPPI